MKIFYIFTIIIIIFIINSISAIIPEDIGIVDKPLPLPSNDENEGIVDKPLPLPSNDENEGFIDKPLPLPSNDENEGFIDKPLPLPLNDENEGIAEKPLPIPLIDENEDIINRPILPLPLNGDSEGMVNETLTIPVHDENEDIIYEPLPLPEEPIGKPLLLPLHEGPPDKPVPPHEDFKENFYLIHIKDTSGSNHNKKRQEISYNVEAAIYEIHNLIVNKMNTYENITILEEMEEMDQHLRKRNIEEYSKKYGESSYIYPIANIDERTVAFAYLSKDVLEEVVTISDVVYVEERMVYQPEESTYYSYNDISDYTHWKNVGVSANAPLHLSLISQGKYSSNFIGKYDTNYYYPESAGKGVDVFIFDNGFNFNHSNFSNTKDRTVRCLLRANKGKITKISGNSCLNNNSNNHGTKIATVLGGYYDGIAKKANIYGIEMTEYSTENIDAALEYIRDHYFNNPNKSIFNLSFGAFYDTQGSEEYKAEQILINQLSNKGAVFVSSAGNNNSPVKSTNSIHLPSQLNNVITVGGIASKDLNDVKSYLKKAPNSNYGEGVDIFAPYTVKLSFRDRNGKLVDKTDCSGTSFSAPIISGVSALIMSENPNKEFDTETMIDYLNNIGQKDAISSLPKYTKNLFVNNGKHIVYSMNSVYYGCGITSGLSTCGSNCCSSNGYCYKSNSSYCTISKGCQSSFGYCKN